MRAVVETTEDVVDQLRGAHNVLVQAPSLERAGSEACTRLLSVASPSSTDVLSVTFNRSPDDRLEEWRALDGPHDAANLGFVVVGDQLRSAAASGPSSAPATPEPGGPTVVSVSSPGDLTGIGLRLGDLLEGWADDDHRLVVCFDSLTTFLQYADLRSVFTFLHVLAGRVTDAGGLAHYHLDPAAHDDATVHALLELVDASVALDDDGRWRVSRRR